MTPEQEVALQEHIDWVKQQPLAQKVACLGDGHDGIWNIIKEIGNQQQRLEIIDWRQ